MSNRVGRRTFLQNAAVATAAGLSNPAFMSAAQSVTSPQAGSLRSKPRLLSGCCAYSYRKYLEHGPMTMEDFILSGVENGLNGVDMTAYYFKSTTPAYLVSLRHLAFKNGVGFSGAACGVSTV